MICLGAVGSASSSDPVADTVKVFASEKGDGPVGYRGPLRYAHSTLRFRMCLGPQRPAEERNGNLAVVDDTAEAVYRHWRTQIRGFPGGTGRGTVLFLGRGHAPVFARVRHRSSCGHGGVGL